MDEHGTLLCAHFMIEIKIAVTFTRDIPLQSVVSPIDVAVADMSGLFFRRDHSFFQFPSAFFEFFVDRFDIRFGLFDIRQETCVA